MPEEIEIPVTYNGKELILLAEVVQKGYTQHIVLLLDDQKVTLERDDSGEYRALINPELVSDHKFDVGLIQAVINVLQDL